MLFRSSEKKRGGSPQEGSHRGLTWAKSVGVVDVNAKWRHLDLQHRRKSATFVSAAGTSTRVRRTDETSPSLPVFGSGILQLVHLAPDLNEAADEIKHISKMDAPREYVDRVQMLQAAYCVHHRASIRASSIDRIAWTSRKAWRARSNLYRTANTSAP